MRPHHDRDSIYAAAVDGAVAAMGLTVIVLNERHLRCVLQKWVGHYDQARPHASLGPGIPDMPLNRLAPPSGHQIPHDQRVIATPILGGLHHEYRLERIAA